MDVYGCVQQILLHLQRGYMGNNNADLIGLT